MMAPRPSKQRDYAHLIIRTRDVAVAVVAIFILVAQVLNWLGWRRETAAEATAKLATEVSHLATVVVRNDSIQNARVTHSDSINRASADELRVIVRNLSYQTCRLSNNPESQCLPVLLGTGAIAVPGRR